ncbi:MAG: hypothetical protein ACI9FJ_000017 [Alteromonadaceae bacterium]|jgi:hypothetical protein
MEQVKVPVRDDIEICPNCDVLVNWDDSQCNGCNHVLVVPNQRELLRDGEVLALKDRYESAVALVNNVGAIKQLKAFEDQVERDSKAVMNMDIDFLYQLLTDDSCMISNYNLQTQGETRKTASMQNDKRRRGVEGTFFGNYAEKIRYAALSLDHQGLTSYGNCTITIADELMQINATVLAENTYDFVGHHSVIAGAAIPQGYRATWATRHLLATAKLASQITANSTDFKSLLLDGSKSQRDSDRFMEVHIYGKIDNQSIEQITLPDKVNALATIQKREQLTLELIKDNAASRGIACES